MWPWWPKVNIFPLGTVESLSLTLGINDGIAEGDKLGSAR